MAAQSACELAETPCAVVPTRSVPEAFAALFGFDEGASLEENVESMTEAYADVKTGEVTVAIKDSKDAHDNPIKEGDVIEAFLMEQIQDRGRGHGAARHDGGRRRRHAHHPGGRGYGG